MIILTGSSGFIGKNFLRVCPDAIQVEQEGAWEFINTFDRWDEVELILHQGAISSTIEKDIRKLYKFNVDFTLALFEKAIQYGIPIKYASSASVYGNVGEINPLNQYAISKLQIDYWVNDNLDKFKLIQGFRYFNVYGNGEENKGDQASPISKFTKQIIDTGKLKLFEGSDQFFRDFIYVNDLVSIVLDNEKGSGIFDLGTSLPTSFEHVAQCVAKKYSGKIEIVAFPEHLIGKYQEYTCALNEWGEYKFVTVDEYLS